MRTRLDCWTLVRLAGAVVVALLFQPYSASALSRRHTGSFLNRAPPRITTWLIDGTNLQCSRTVPNDRDQILQALFAIATPPDPANTGASNSKQDRIDNVVVVFDGNEDESFQLYSKGPNFEWVITDGKGRIKDRADNYIVDKALPSILGLGGRIHLVSADNALGKRVQASGKMKGGSVIHPPKFWREFLPTLAK